VLTIQIVGKEKFHPVYQSEIDEWQSVYRGINFLDELQKCRLWNQQNPERRKTGREIDRTTMSNWAMRAAEACVPLHNLIRDEILAARLINIDETTVQVLAEPGRPATATSYMWLFRRGDPDRPALVYQDHPTRADDIARTILGDYQGIVQTDGFSGYDFLDHYAGVRHAGCMAHVRRKFMEVVKAQGKNFTSENADYVLMTNQKIYALEKEATVKRWSPGTIRTMRAGKAQPILDAFH